MKTDLLRQQIGDYLEITNLNTFSGYRVVSELKCSGYTRLLVHYAGSENDLIPAYLLIPEGPGIFPAVLIHHQHNGERHLGKSEVCGIAGNPLQAFGVELVKKGFIVLAPDSICFEDRRTSATGILPDEEKDFLQHYNEMCYRIIKGSSLMKKVIDDANIGVSLLKNHKKVDKKRIGILGHSYGGNTVLFQAALSEEISFSCSSGAACTYKSKMEYGTGIEMAEVIPGFNNKYDIYDLVKCIAPRHVLLVSAAQDKYSMDADYIEEQSRIVFNEFNCSENFQHKRYNGGHALTQERFEYIVNWIEQVVNKI
jgi:dienelactone hydrolase